MQSIQSMEPEYQRELRVKKPSNPKRKTARPTIKSVAPSQAKPARRSRTRKLRPASSRTPKRSRPRQASTAPTRMPLVAQGYSADERQALLLLLTPVVIMTIAVGMGQALMQRAPPVWHVARSLGPTMVARPVSPSELVTALAGPVEALPPSGTLNPASAVEPPPPLRASPAPGALEASPTLVRLETSPPPAALREFFSPAALAASAPVEVATRAATVDVLGRCEAPWRTPGKPQLTAVATADSVDFGRKLARAARAQTQDLVVYTNKYRTISFPMGDVPPLYGVCTDLVIRAYRALGVDLQVLVHKARIGTGDPSIDHRRTKTLRRFFARHGASIPVTEFPEDYQPGDIVTYHQPLGRGSQLHIAIVSDVIAASGRPMIVHNRGWGPQLEDALFFNQITGHYRYAGPAQEQKASAPRTLPLGSRPVQKPATVLSAR